MSFVSKHHVSASVPFKITLERQEGITYRIEGSRIVFTAGETTAAFELPETAQILTNRTEEAEIIVTLAKNGGLQIKSRV